MSFHISVWLRAEPDTRKTQDIIYLFDSHRGFLRTIIVYVSYRVRQTHKYRGHVAASFCRITVNDAKTLTSARGHRTNRTSFFFRRNSVVFGLKRFCFHRVPRRLHQFVSESKSSHNDRRRSSFHQRGCARRCRHKTFHRFGRTRAYRSERQTNLPTPCWDTGFELVAWRMCIYYRPYTTATLLRNYVRY